MCGKPVDKRHGEGINKTRIRSLPAHSINPLPCSPWEYRERDTERGELQNRMILAETSLLDGFSQNQLIRHAG